MKKFTAILLAIVMAFTVVSVVACNSEKTIRVTIYVTENSSPRVCNHVIGKDDLPIVTNGDLVFDGWFYDKAFGKEYKYTDTDIEDGAVLYARWKQGGSAANKVTLTFDCNYVGGTSQSFEIDKNSTFELITVTRTGYTFAGWFTQPVDGMQWTNSLPVSVDTTLYAHWTKTGGGDASNPAELKEVFSKYSDYFTWNFVVNLTMVDGTDTEKEYFEYCGDKILNRYTYDGEEYTEFLAYDEDGTAYYYYDNGDGTYEKFSDDSDDFQALFGMYIIYLEEIGDYTFVKASDGCYTAQDPDAAGKAVIADFADGSTWTSFTVYVANGSITKLVGVMSDGYTMTFEFSKYGEANVTLPDGEGGNDTPDPSEHNFGDNYFIYVKCSDEGCDVIGRKASANSFKTDFTYSYTQADYDSLKNTYNTLVAQIKNGTTSVNAIDNVIESLEALIDDIEYQYQVATVMLSVYYDDEWTEKSTLIGNAYNDWFKFYYTLFGIIDDSQYGSEYFSNWKTDDKEYVLEQAAIYSASEDNLQNVADNLANEYNDALSDILNSNSGSVDWSQLYEPYSKYVQANNNIAAQYGDKYDNYMDYAYANEYGREYTPAEVAVMRNYVKTVIAPILLDLYGKYSQMQDFGYADEEKGKYVFYDGMEDDYAFYDSLALSSLFTLDRGYEQGTYDATNYIGNYFKYLNNNKTGSKEINFYKAVNELFKNGNYFTSDDGEEGAYTYYIEKKKTPIMYFDDSYDYYYGYSYSTAFTFIHEFGHYYADIYTKGGKFSMDHAETHSQGDEMLFLAWLSENCPAGAEFGYKVLQIEQLVNLLITVVQATIVDEFEQAVYSNTYGDGKFKDGIAYSQYGELYNAIVDSYGEGMSNLLNEAYWMYVVVDSSAYYISYAMSALPSVELFVQAMTNGVDSARETYFKLFTYIDSSDADADGDGKVTYSEALAYAGLANPFSENMYTAISDYFKTYSVE